MGNAEDFGSWNTHKESERIEDISEHQLKGECIDAEATAYPSKQSVDRVNYGMSIPKLLGE